jgi:hypothetical protein
MLSDVKWRYPRPVTTFAVQVLCVIATFVARAMLPRSSRPSRLVDVALASAGAYATVRLGSHSGWSKRFKHRVLDWFGGDVDDAQTWILGVAGGGGCLVVIRVVRDGIARLSRSPHVHQ